MAFLCVPPIVTPAKRAFALAPVPQTPLRHPGTPFEGSKPFFFFGFRALRQIFVFSSGLKSWPPTF